MKKNNYLFITGLVGIVLFSGFSLISFNRKNMQDENKSFPENVNQVLQKNCAGCHSTESMNEKAKEKLNLTKWEDYSTISKISKLNDIDKVASEGSMPPARFLERFPDKKLTEDEAKILSDWAKQEAENLAK